MSRSRSQAQQSSAAASLPAHRGRSTPLREFIAQSTAQNAAVYPLDAYFGDVPEALEFGSAWSEMSDAKVLSGSMLTSSLRRAGIGGAAASSGPKAAGSAPFLPRIGNAAGGASSSSSAAAGGTFGSRLSLMGPSGENAVGLGVSRRFLNVTFFPQLSQVQVTTDDAKVPLTIRIFNRRGEPLQPWDFYVGAVIDILGRPTTLSSASATTQAWLDANARRLWRAKVQLEERLNKFRVRPRADLENGPFRKLQQPGTALGGSIALNQLATCLARLEEELRSYQ